MSRDNFERDLRDWVIPPTALDWIRGPDGKLAMGLVLARGTQGTVYKSKYGGHTVAVKEFHSTVIRGLEVEIPGLTVTSAPGMAPSRTEMAIGNKDKDKEKDHKKKATESLLSDQSMTEFFTEVRALHALHHPSCVALYGISLKPTVFFVTEFCPDNLSRVLFAPGLSLSLLAILRWARQIAAGMEYLHAKGITHRDLKPENILLTRTGAQLSEADAKICDFGIALLDRNSARGRGTPHYLAPELYKTPLAAKTNHRAADIYAFGMMLWVMITRKKPFRDVDALDIADVVIKGQRPIIPDKIPNALSGLIRKCWLPDPESRPSFVQAYSDLSDLEHKVDSGQMSFPIPDLFSLDGRVLFGFGMGSDRLATVDVTLHGVEAHPFPATIPRCLIIIWQIMVQKGALSAEGIFRVSPSGMVYQDFRSLVYRPGVSDDKKMEEMNKADVYTLSRLMQDFFRDVPGGFFQGQQARSLQRLNHITWMSKSQILTSTHDDRENTTIEKTNEFNSPAIVISLKDMLSKEKYWMLSWLLDVLGEVLTHVQTNKMGADALALVWGQSLDEWQSSVEPTLEQRLQQLSHNESVRGLIKRLVVLKMQNLSLTNFHQHVREDSAFMGSDGPSSPVQSSSSLAGQGAGGAGGVGDHPGSPTSSLPSAQSQGISSGSATSSPAIGGRELSTGQDGRGSQVKLQVTANTQLIDVFRVMFHAQSAMKWLDSVKILQQQGISTMGGLWKLPDSAPPPTPSWESLSGQMLDLHAQQLGKFRLQTRPKEYQQLSVQAQQHAAHQHPQDQLSNSTESAGPSPQSLVSMTVEESELEAVNAHKQRRDRGSAVIDEVVFSGEETSVSASLSSGSGSSASAGPSTSTSTEGGSGAHAPSVSVGTSSSNLSNSSSSSSSSGSSSAAGGSGTWAIPTRFTDSLAGLSSFLRKSG